MQKYGSDKIFIDNATQNQFLLQEMFKSANYVIQQIKNSRLKNLSISLCNLSDILFSLSINTKQHLYQYDDVANSKPFVVGDVNDSGPTAGTYARWKFLQYTAHITMKFI